MIEREITFSNEYLRIWPDRTWVLVFCKPVLKKRYKYCQNDSSRSGSRNCHWCYAECKGSLVLFGKI